MPLSKTQYMKGCQCPLALWNYRNLPRPETSPAQEAIFEQGTQVGELAKQLFPGGVEVTAEFYATDEALTQTRAFLEEGHEFIFEATAQNPDDESYCRIDILRKNEDETFDLIEVKSSTRPHEYQIEDVSFQRHVFTGAGFNIKRSFLLLINSAYERQGDIDPNELFALHDVTDEALLRQPSVANRIPAFELVLENGEPVTDIGAHCFDPFECDYRDQCWRDAPEYSIFNVFNKKKAEEIYKAHKFLDPAEVPEHLYPGGKKLIDLTTHRRGTEYIEKESLEGFLEPLQYPLYFLDYETIGGPIPWFDGSRPYQQVPFQFSLHIQPASGAEMKHHEFLHTDRTDPREPFTKALCRLLEGEGSVVVYNQSFEAGRNRELAAMLPEYEKMLQNINDRMVDLLIPFRSRWLYHPDQKGSASIKFVLSAFTDMAYEGMDIADGGDASFKYQCFMAGQLSDQEANQVFENLREYCALDTLAMVKLLNVIREKLGP